MSAPSPASTGFRRLSVVTAAATLVLIAVGGMVRSSGSGLACPDWPRCYGRWIPLARDLPEGLSLWSVWLEHTHRLLASVVGLLILALAVWAVRSYRRRGDLVWPAVAAVVLVGVQAWLGRQVVLGLLEAWLVTAHLGLAMVVLAVLLYLAVNAHVPRAAGASDGSGFARLAAVTAGICYVQLLVGATVTGFGAGLVFRDFPLMDGAILPVVADARAGLHVAHRLLAYLLAAAVVFLAMRAARLRPVLQANGDWQAAQRWLVRLPVWAAVLVLAQVGIGAVNIWTGTPWPVVTTHLAVASWLWAALVVLTVLAYRLAPRSDPEPAPAVHDAAGDRAHRWRDTISAYVGLTKPRIIELLLVTTVPTMFVAARGVPDLRLVAATLIGGSLAAGSANTFNCYVDRDIDAQMVRTRQRALARDAIPPRNALLFGVVLGVSSFVWLAVTVNALSAVLAAGAILFYVFVYTLGLKRRTTQNIVIGGAAGCVPVLVGWAAVTGEVGLPALVLFAIVFYWTPPHFWALALKFRDDYARAGVPMLPVVRGVAETARQILLYTILLVAVTLIFGAVGEMGMLYLAGAILLGGVFIFRAVELLRTLSERVAMQLFRYSIVYLALLFGLMAIDAVVTPI